MKKKTSRASSGLFFLCFVFVFFCASQTRSCRRRRRRRRYSVFPSSLFENKRFEMVCQRLYGCEEARKKKKKKKKTNNEKTAVRSLAVVPTHSFALRKLSVSIFNGHFLSDSRPVFESPGVAWRFSAAVQHQLHLYLHAFFILFFFFLALCRYLVRNSLTTVAGISRSDAAASIATYWQRRVTVAEGATEPNFANTDTKL